MSVSQAEALATRNALGYYATQWLRAKSPELKRAIDLQIQGLNRGHPPLHETGKCFVDWVLKNPTTTIDLYGSAFLTALNVRYCEGVKALVQRGAIAQPYYYREFLLANERGDMPMVRAFLESGKMAPGFVNQAFGLACEKRDFETLKSLSTLTIHDPIFIETYSYYTVIEDREMLAALDRFEQAVLNKRVEPSPYSTTASDPSHSPEVILEELPGWLTPSEQVEEMLLFPSEFTRQ
jgi:hypothetical protein